MSKPITVVSNLHGQTADVRGRYAIGGPGFEIVSDGSVRSGGPGEEASSLDLLIASLCPAR
jgi:hypothetical protein